MYGPILLAHSYLRWLVLLAVLGLGIRSWHGWRRGRAWEREDERKHVLTIAVVDSQLGLGLWLYFGLSPLPGAFWADVSVGMKQSALRFFGMEHALGMVIAIILLHIGRATSKRMKEAARRHRRVWTTTLAAFLIVLASVPWPGTRHARPLLRAPQARLGYRDGTAREMVVAESPNRGRDVF